MTPALAEFRNVAGALFTLANHTIADRDAELLVDDHTRLGPVAQTPAAHAIPLKRPVDRAWTDMAQIEISCGTAQNVKDYSRISKCL